MDALDSSDDDYAIIRRVLAGERDDFRLLILRHQNMIVALLMRQIGDHAAAEDLTKKLLCELTEPSSVSI